jgi:AraC-like DNA-binding protein
MSHYTAASGDIHYHVPKAGLDEIARDHGVEPVGSYKFTICEHDIVLAQLGSRDWTNSLMLDQVSLILGAHVLKTYAGLPPLGVEKRIGLAPWQGRRAAEMMRENLDGNVRLSELARECGLSVSHFARAFRKSLGVSPYRWLLERRIDYAKALLIARLFAIIHNQARQYNLPIRNVMVDAFSSYLLPRPNDPNSLDQPTFRQLGNDKVSLGIGVRVGGVGDLECELGQGEARVSCAGPGPDNTCVVRRTVGVEPKIAGSPRVIGVRKSQCPKSYVMPFPRTVIDGLLKADVLAAPKKIEGAEGSGRVRRIENERASHVPGAFKAQPICFRPAKGRKGRLKLLESAYERNIDRIAREPIARDCEAGHKLAL